MNTDLLPLSEAKPSSGHSFPPHAVAQMEQLVDDVKRMYHERNEALQEVARAHHEALLRLSVAAEFRDEDTGEHIVRIGFLAEALALMLGQSKDYARMLRKAAPMHDIGKIGIADSVLKKAGGFNPQERAAMNEHSRMGARILGRSRIPLFQMAAEIALTHHEKFDGTGYPDGLAGERIPLSGRITAVVDFYDALTMDRVYRRAFAPQRALEMLMLQRGRAFDPAIVDVFAQNFVEIEALRQHLHQQGHTFEALLDAPNAEPLLEP
jgi:putative two-component system response regulator